MIPHTGPIAQLESIPLRIAWAHEAQNFTPWIEANLPRLSEAIGMPMILVDAKVVAGAQIADVLARDERDGSMVVIENQLEAADDAHLGQVLTYVAAVDARAVVWIAERFSEPHLSAIRWLNAKAGISFFAARIRVVRIDGSALASVFDVIERPNVRERSPRAATSEAASPLSGFAGAFWAAHLQRHPDEAEHSRPVGERCRWIATKPAGVVIGQFVETHSASVFLRGRHGVTLEAAYAALAPFADKLERRLGVRLRGDRPALLAVKTPDINVADPATWPDVSDWLREQARDYDMALREFARESTRRR